jgi:hypothetical protein
MALKFTKATKKQAKLRMAIDGPSGSGKTYTALRIATALGQRVAVIDSERGSASKYADQFEFDVLELDGDFAPNTYSEAIRAAGAEGYDVIIVDSLSHAWEGALEEVDKVVKRSRSGNSFNAWKDVTPMHNRLVQTILSSTAHVVVTMRVKTEWVQERDERTGKLAPKKVGMAPIQRAGVEYEFDVVGDLDLEHNLIISKTRCPKLDGGVFPRPGPEVAAVLSEWLSDGVAAEPMTQLAESVSLVMAELEAKFASVNDPETLEAAKSAVRVEWKTLSKPEQARVLELKAEAEQRLAS